MFSFLDNLCNCNNDEFQNNCNDSYPDEMELKKENEDSCKASFLDFSIEVHNRKFTIKLLHKRIAFPFYINRRPYLDSNAPSKIFYALVGSKMLRVARATTEHMVTHIKLL